MRTSRGIVGARERYQIVFGPPPGHWLSPVRPDVRSSVIRVLAEFPRSHNGLRVTQAVVVVFALMTGGTGTFLVSQGSQATVISADDVLADFRQVATPSPGEFATSVVDGAGQPATQTAGDAPVASEPAADTGSTESEVVEPRAPMAAPGGAIPGDQPSVAESAPVGSDGAPTFGTPTEGVYTYATTGWETVSMAGARHDYPAETFAAVRHLGGCRWETDHRFLEEHRERKEYCSDGSALLALGFDSYITFFGQTAESHGRCDPPQVSAHLPADPGQRYTSTCAGDGWTSDAIVTFVGREAVEVAGQSVEGLHYTQETTLHGSNRGESHMDVWYHPQTGLPLQVIRRTQSFAHAFGSEVVYNEDVHLVLTSLDPQR